MLNWRAQDGRARGCARYHGQHRRCASYGPQLRICERCPAAPHDAMPQ
jgi:hypothetical protein